MTDFEAVTQIKNNSGASYEDSKRAYEECGKDMLAAVIALEKKSTVKPVLSDSFKTTVKENSRRAARSAGGFINKLARNSFKISGAKDYFTMPLLAAVIIGLVGFEIMLPVSIIALICGINFTVTGPDFCNDLTLGFKRNESPVIVNMNPSQYGFTDEADKGFFNK